MRQALRRPKVGALSSAGHTGSESPAQGPTGGIRSRGVQGDRTDAPSCSSSSLYKPQGTPGCALTLSTC